MPAKKRTSVKGTRLHDLKSSYMNFVFIVGLLKSGQRIEDEDLPSVVQQLEKSLDVIKSEIGYIEAKQKHEKKH